MSQTSRTWGRKSSFWVAAAVVVHTLWTSAAPAMMYPLYAHQWQLTPTVTTLIFAVFPVFVVATLIALGDLSDYIGRRAAMLWGLTASLIGVLLFAIAPDVTWLLVDGRSWVSASGFPQALQRPPWWSSARREKPGLPAPLPPPRRHSVWQRH